MSRCDCAAKAILATAAAMGFVAVTAGAFAAHGLEKHLEPRMLEVFKTGAQYQMYHALAMFGCGIMAMHGIGGAWARRAAWTFAAGIVLFSGSLYALAPSGIKALGAITPFGGIAFLAGWALLAVGALKARGVTSS